MTLGCLTWVCMLREGKGLLRFSSLHRITDECFLLGVLLTRFVSVHVWTSTAVESAKLCTGLGFVEKPWDCFASLAKMFTFSVVTLPGNDRNFIVIAENSEWNFCGSAEADSYIVIAI
jgi:hypothetical protein